MPNRAKMTQDMVFLSQAVHWIAYDRLEGPSAEHLEQFRIKSEASVTGPHNWMRQSPEAIQDTHEKAFRDDLSIALRDGCLRAEGRLSETLSEPWNSTYSSWSLHSGKFTPIPVEFWVGGKIDWGKNSLTYREGQYIDVRLPLFFLQAIWPIPQDPPPTFEIPRGGTLPFAPTPYLELLNRAVEKFWASGAPPSEKKEVLVQWLVEQKMGDEQLSRNLAECMATLIRPLEARSGGNRKWT